MERDQRERRWGLGSTEWADCVQAAWELAQLAPGERTPTADEIAAQLAMAKAAEEPGDDGPVRTVPIGSVQATWRP